MDKVLGSNGNSGLEAALRSVLGQLFQSHLRRFSGTPEEAHRSFERQCDKVLDHFAHMIGGSLIALEPEPTVATPEEMERLRKMAEEISGRSDGDTTEKFFRFLMDRAGLTPPEVSSPPRGEAPPAIDDWRNYKDGIKIK